MEGKHMKLESTLFLSSKVPLKEDRLGMLTTQGDSLTERRNSGLTEAYNVHPHQQC